MKRLSNKETVEHYISLIKGQLDTWENALDDDMADEWDELVAIVDEFHGEVDNRY
jgi:hypothetical protein